MCRVCGLHWRPKWRICNGLDVDADDEVTVTSGATEALFCAISCVIGAGDEAIVFDPAYDSYEPVINLHGGRARHIPLHAPEFRVDWEVVERTITSRTRLIIINSPHNPTGTVLLAEDLEQLQALATRHGLWVVSDEVYEAHHFRRVCGTRACAGIQSFIAAVSSSRRWARPTTPPAGKWVTAWRRPR